MIEIVHAPIDASQVLEHAKSALSGAVVLFLGTTRQYTADMETVELEYESYETMALNKMAQLRDRAVANWSLNGCVIVHRVGLVPVGEVSVAIAVSTPHRKQAFEAAEWLIDRLKVEVPIWKKECFADGTTEWVHPQSPV